MAYNPQYPPLNSLSLLFLISLLVITHLSIAAAREIPTTSKNSDIKKPEGYIDRDGSVLIPGIGRFMVPSLGGISGKIDDSEGFGGIVDRYLPGVGSPLIPNTQVKVSEPSGSTSSNPTSPSFYHPGVKASESAIKDSSVPILPSSSHPGVKTSESATSGSSVPTLPSSSHPEVKASESAISGSSISTASNPPSS